MLGVIWFAQAVHYPLLGRVRGEAFVEYEKENTRRTGWVVLPVMTAEGITALLLLWSQPEGFLPSYAWLKRGPPGGDMGFHCTLQGPYHNLLVKRFDLAVWGSLVRTNWVRTAAWTARGILLLFILTEVWAKGG